MPSPTSPFVRVYLDGTHAVAQKPNGTIITASDTHNEVINAALATGKRVVLDAGTFNIMSPILVPDGVVLEGSGRGITVLKVPDSTSVDAVIQNEGYGSGTSNIRFKVANLTIDGNKGNGASGIGIKLKSYRAVIEDVEILNVSSHGLLIDGGGKNIIRGIRVDGAGNCGIKLSAGGNRVLETEISNSGGDGIYLLSNKNTIVASTIGGSGGKGIRATNSSANVILGNVISTASYAAVRVEAVTGVSPYGNIIKGNIIIATDEISYSGVEIDGYNSDYLIIGTIVEGNVFREEGGGAFTHAVYGTEENYTLVHGNFVDGNAITSDVFVLSGANSSSLDNKILEAGSEPPGSV